MKIVAEVDVVAKGDFPESELWTRACEDVERAIACVDWPHGSGTFKIRPVRKGNGVVPIKVPCMQHLVGCGWDVEDFPQLPESVLTPGDLDGLLIEGSSRVAFEWETGNISSSHRALNKLVLGISYEVVSGGILVLPVRSLGRYLTDRIGTFEEIEPYLDLWKMAIDGSAVSTAALRIYTVGQDTDCSAAPLIPKGTDGRALI